MSTATRFIYIYNNSLDFGEDVFDSYITVHAPTGSTAEEYCAKNGIAFASTSVVYSYMADVDFESGDYSPYIGNFVVTQPQGAADTKSFEGITYGSNPRNDAWPDATTGIKMGSENGNTYVVPVAGEFSTGGRHSWIDIDEKVDLSTVSEYTLSFDILYPTDCGTLYLTLTNGEKTVDGIEMTSDMSPDTWYTYTYAYDSKKNLTRTIRQGNTIISTTPLGSRAADTYGINHIDFTRDDNGPNPSTLWGGWGNHGMGKCALAYMDNIRVYTPERSSALFKILDNYGFAVEGATVTMGSVTVKTDSNGEAKIAAQNGEYEAVISAEGYSTITRTVSLLDGITAVEAALAPSLAVSFDREELKLAKDAYFIAGYEVKPVERGFTEFTSSDSSVAEVDSDGIIHGIGAGEADITVTNMGMSDILHVTVADSDGEAAAISLTGEKSCHTASYLAPYTSVIRAEVYDKDGSLINAPVSFYADNANITASETGAMFTVNENLKSFTLTAECGSARTEEKITVNSAADYANSAFDSGAVMLQGKEAQSQTVGESGVTLNVGNRGGGGDNFTGFIMKDGILTAQAGQYNTASRNAYITLDNAPSMKKDTEYMLRTRIRFNSGAGDATVTVGDGTVAAVTLSPTRTGFEKDVWYDYILSVRDGASTQIIRNESTGEVSTESVSVSAAKLSRIDITNADGARSSVSFDSLSLTGADKIIASAVVSVTDEYGELIEGADVKGALGEGTTRINGRVTIPCFDGANTFDVVAGGRSKTITSIVSGSFSPVTAAMTDDRTLLRRAADDKPVYYVISYEDTAARAIKGNFTDSGAFSGAESKDVIKGKSIVSFTDTDSQEKIFLWKNEMEPVANAAE